MRTVAHRGASALAPENTVAAVRLAAELGADFVEVDLHLSRDRRLIVHHDAARVLPSGRLVAIRDVDAAVMTAPEPGEAPVPLLEEILAVATGRVGLYLELKAAGTADALAELLDRTPAAHRPELIVGSFRVELVHRLRELLPMVPRSILFGETTVDRMVAACRAVAAGYAHPCRRPIRSEMVVRLHAAGLAVMSPHSNDLGELRRFVAAGVDVVASDDPRLFREVLVSE